MTHPDTSSASDRWHQVRLLFDEVVDLAPGERTTRLQAAEGRDPGIRGEVESLLAAYDARDAQVLDALEKLIHTPFVAEAVAPEPIAGVGTLMGSYRILQEIGRGGMGVVFKAHDEKLDRTVALKFLPPHQQLDEDAKRRFFAEARAASALDHPNICTVHEIHEGEDGHLFIAMAFCEGQTLRRLIQQGPLPLDQVIDLALQVAGGLAAAHAKGVVHRDLKPSNVLVTEEGTAKIVDFGVAKRAGLDLTRTGVTLGTIAYMSPEQVRGENVDGRSDLWALGVLLYEMTTGRHPFTGAYDQTVLYQILHEAPPPAPELRPDLPFLLDQIICRCLEKDPDLRYPSMAALKEDLARLQPRVKARRSGSLSGLAWPVNRARFFLRRHARLALGLGLLLVLLPVLFLILAGPGGSTRNASFLRWIGTSNLPDERRLIVLPIKYLGTDAALDDLSQGLTEILTNRLAQLEPFAGQSLLVIPTSDAREYEVNSPGRARGRLGATLAVEASLLHNQSNVRLTLSLIDTRQESAILEATQFNARADSLLALEEEAVAWLAQQLDIELGPEHRSALAAGGTTVPNAYALYLQGRGYLQRYEKQENIETAVSLFGRALEQDSLYTLAHAGLGEAYWRLYELTRDQQWVPEAVRYSEQAVRLNARLTPVLVTVGLVNQGTGRYREAIRAFRQALALEPANTNAYRGLGKAHESLGEIVQAEAAFQKAVTLRPDDWAGYNDLGIFYHGQGRYEDAELQFKNVVELTPDNVRGWSNLGAMYFYQDRDEWGDARRAFERSIELEPNDRAYYNLANLYYYEEQFVEAARYYEQALSIKNNNYRLWGALASAYAAVGDHVRATEKFRQAIVLAEEELRVNPHDTYTLADLAGYHLSLKNRQEALAVLQRLGDLAADNVETMSIVAETYEQLGERERALEWIDRALRNGYSRAQIESAPALQALRADARFQRILREAPQD